jgi:hypothetical protein
MPRTTRTTPRRLALVAAAAGGLVLATAAPAAAHDHTFEIFRNIARKGTVKISNHHKTIEVCDTLSDNVGVWAEFYVHHAGGDDRYRTLRDTDGHGGDCGRYTAQGADYITILRGHSRDGGLISNSPAWFNA